VIIAGLALLAAVAAAVWVYDGTVRAEVTESSIRSGRVRGTVRMVQISDLHGRTRLWNGSVAEVVHSLRPDIVCVTGDLFNRLGQLPKVIQELERIECRHLFFVPGNHERKEQIGPLLSRAFDEGEFTDVLRRIGTGRIRVLANEGEMVELGNTRVFVYGFDNSRYGKERYRPPEGEPEGAFRLVLAHSPSIEGWMAKHGVGYDLLLAGHTHGGQIRFVRQLLKRYRRYHVGLKRTGPDRYFYVHRGVGTVHLPLRIACRPEIALFRIDPKD